LKRPEYDATRWLAQARDDLAFARWVLGADRFYDKGCFVAQQAAEKALKAALYLDGARIVLGHSILDLLERLISNHPELSLLRDDARQLDRFYIPARYPDGLPGGAPFESFIREDLEKALAMAERIVAAAGDLVTPSS
jgi:HEPN domain-containing protein